MNVSAVIVTRGDVDLSPVFDSLPRDWQKVVYDNSVRENLGVYGRYAAIEECEHDVIYMQDDDCVLEQESLDMLVSLAEPPHARIVANMPARFRAHYSDSCLVGFGAVFHRDLPERAFQRFTDYGITVPIDTDPAFFYRECDTVFTTLTSRILVDLPYTDLPWASAPNRLWKQPEHVAERKRMLELARKVRDA